MGSVWLFGVLQGSQPTSIRQARSGGAGFHVPGVGCPSSRVARGVGGQGECWQGSESGESGGDQLNPGCSRGLSQLGSAGAAADAAGRSCLG